MQALTSIEKRVVAEASRGCGIKETATGLGRSVDTVKQHRSSAIRKLEARSMTHAVAIAIGAGLIGAP